MNRIAAFVLAFLVLLASANANLRHGSGTTILAPVVISGISSTTTASTAAITWTNTPATALGQVCYGAPGGPPNVYGPPTGTCTVRDTVAMAPDTATLSGLTPSSTYHFQINATAVGSAQGFSHPDQIFTTGAPIVGCAYPTAPVDGCGQSNGIYYAPWIAPADPRVPVAKPTAAQFSNYVRTSGQPWTATPGQPLSTADHPQPFNVAGVDYPIGPNIPVSAMADIAGWTQGTNNCVYMSAADGYPGSPAAWSGTGHMTSALGFSTLLIDSTTPGTGPLAPGMSLITPVSGLLTGTIVLSGSGTTFQLNKTQFLTATPVALSATNTYYGASPGFTFFQGAPAFVCTGSSTNAFVISGWNFGPTAFQTTPVGPTHNCVNFVFLPSSSTSYAQPSGSNPGVTISNNAFIDGETCSLVENTYGMSVTNTSNVFPASLKIWNNFHWGRGTDPCCQKHISYPYALAKLQGNLDVEFNWTYQTTDGFLTAGWATGRENLFPCANGTPYSWPGYTMIENFNYVDSFDQLYDGAHGEWGGLGIGSSVASQAMCIIRQNYNTSVVIPPMPAEAETTFFGFAVTGILGIDEYSEQIGNTATSNMVGNKSYLDPVDYFNYVTDGCPTLSALCPSGNGTTPQNHFIITSFGSSCGSCTAPVQGQGNGNYGLAAEASATPGFGTWNGGCNENNPPLCSGESPQLLPNVQYPGTASNTAMTAGSSGVPISTSATIPLSASSTCPTSTKYEGAILTDTGAGGAYVGIVGTTPGSCVSGVSLTLTALNASAVTANDALQLWGAQQNIPFFSAIINTPLSVWGHGSSLFTTAIATIPTSTCTSPTVCNTITLASCPTVTDPYRPFNVGIQNSVVTQGGVFIGEAFTCSGGLVTLYANVAANVAAASVNFATFAYGSNVRHINYIDNSSSANAVGLTGGATYTFNVTALTNGGFQAGAGGGTIGAGGCAFPSDNGTVGAGNQNILLTTGVALTAPSGTSGGC